MRRVLRRLTFTIQWDKLHFCKEDKVRYRKHLTYGTLGATAISMIGAVYDNAWLVNIGAVSNCITALIWIWE